MNLSTTGETQRITPKMPATATFDFSGHNAVVTGAGSGIGRDIAIALHKANANVFGIGRKQAGLDSLSAELGDKFKAYQCDLGDSDAIAQTFEAIAADVQGGIHMMVNNAGITHCEPVLDFPLDQFNKIMDVNVRAAFQMTQLAAKNMIAHGNKGSIVNVSSNASMSALPDHVAYCASKAALDMMTDVCALELGTF